MYIRIVYEVPYVEGAPVDSIHEVLAHDTHDEGYYLIPVPWGAEYELEEDRYEILSQRYDVYEHAEGCYAWVHNSDIEECEPPSNKHLVFRLLEEEY